MKKFICSVLAGLALFAAPSAYAIPAERVKNEKAVYNEEGGYVLITATTPTKTEFDWDYTFTQEDLTHISYVLIERHTPGTSWDNSEIGRVENLDPGQDFDFRDMNVQPDKRYEYRVTCYVDGEKGSPTWLNIYTGVTPGAVQYISATPPDHLSNYVDVTVTAPSLSKGGVALTSNVSILIQSYSMLEWSDLHTIENVVPGSTVTWRHENLETGKAYHYRAVAVNGTSGTGEGLETSTFVGLDTPGTPANFNVESDGTTVTLTWEAPAKGSNGGCYDPENTDYGVYAKFADEEDYTIVAGGAGLKTTSFSYMPGFDEESVVYYAVTAVNDAGQSLIPATADPVSAGGPAVLPFKESFTGARLDHKGWSTLSTQDDPDYTYYAWHVLPYKTMYYFPLDSDIQIDPQDYDGGIMVCYFYGYSPDGQTESFISPRIDFTQTVNPSLTFHYFETSPEASPNAVAAWVSSDGGEWEQVFASTPNPAAQPAWKEVAVSLREYAGCDNLRVRLDAIRHDGVVADVYLDNISVTDPGLVGIGDVMSDDSAPAEYFTLEGVRLGEHPTAAGIYIVKRGDTAAKIIIR